ncbi:MAG: DUF58 domain-containing protein [Pseudomonadota bacterium]
MKPSVILLLLLMLGLLLGLLASLANLFSWTLAFEFQAVFWGWLGLVGMIAILDVTSLRAPSFEVSRELDSHLALGIRHSVGIKVTNQGSRVEHLSLVDYPPAEIHFEGLPARIDLKPDEFAEIEYFITPQQRGLAEFGRIACRVSSGWRLWERNFRYGEVQQSKVYPNYKPLFRSSFIGSEQLYADLGLQLQQRRGEGTDFRQLRDFRVGDSLRQVDWRATARFQKPISREYQDERDQQVVFVLDCGRRMRARDGEISHFDHALNALLISAFVALRQGDSVGLLSFAGQSRWVPPFKGQFNISHLLDQIYDLDCSPATSDYLEVAQQLMTRQKRRSLMVLISSLEPQDNDDLVATAKLLSKHHLVMLASMRQQVLTDTLASEINSMDDALKYCGVAHHMEDQAGMFAELRSQNIIVADTAPAHMHTTLINEYMALKRSGIF